MQENDFLPIVLKKLPLRIGPISTVILIILVWSLTLRLINYFGPAYDTISFLPSEVMFLLPLTFFLYCVGLFIEDDLPREASILEGIWLLNITAVTINVLAGSVQATPFAAINQLIHHMDLAMGFHEGHMLNWTFAHAGLYDLLIRMYNFLYLELTFIPVILLLGLQHRAIRVYCLSCLLAALIGMTFYYFFPTNGPAAILHNSHFLKEMYWTSERFRAMQAHQPVLQSTAAGGLIAFPSFHVIWATALIYATLRLKPLFFTLLIVNSLIIFSTIGLGWHFLSDVIAALILLAFTTYLAEKIYCYSFPKEISFPQYQLF